MGLYTKKMYCKTLQDEPSCAVISTLHALVLDACANRQVNMLIQQKVDQLVDKLTVCTHCS